MKNKFKPFDIRVFWEAFNRLKIPGIIGSAILLSASFILMLTCSVELLVDDIRSIEIPAEYFYVTYLVPFLSVPMMLMVSFSYLKSRKTSDFYHSIPIRRETLYFSTIVAAISWVVVILFVASIVPLTSALFSFAMEIDMSVYWEIMGTVFLASIFMISGFALGISITGNGFTNFFVPLMILFLPRIIITIICGVVEEFTPFLELNVGNTLINNQYNIIFRMFSFGSAKISWINTIIYTLIVSFAYLVIGAIAFIRRKSEMAGRPSAFKGVQVATRMIVPFIILLGAMYLVMYPSYYGDYDLEMYFFSISLVIIAFTVYFLYELITIRRIKLVAKSLVWFPVLVGGVITLGGVISMGSYIATSRDIDEDDIKYIVVSNMAEFVQDDKLHKLSNEDAFEIIADVYAEQMDAWEWGNDKYEFEYDYEYSTEIIVGINTGGFTFYRELYFDYDDYVELQRICIDEIYDDDYKLDIPVYSEHSVEIHMSRLDYRDVKEIYNVLRKELRKVPAKDVYDVRDDEIITSVTISSYDLNGYVSIEIPISKNTPKTLKALTKAIVDGNYEYYDNNLYEDYLSELDEDFHLEAGLSDALVIYEDDECYICPDIYISDYGYSKEAVIEMFKMLEESKKGDVVIVISGWMESYDVNMDYFSSEYVDNKYFVTEEVAEKFIEYMEEIYEYSYEY